MMAAPAAALLCAMLFSSCTSITVLRTHEVKAIMDSSMVIMSKRVDSLSLVIDSMRAGQEKSLSRLNAEFAHISSKVSIQGDKSEARMEEIAFRLDQLLAAAQKSTAAKSSAQGAKSAAEQPNSEMESLYSASRADYLRGEYAVAYNGFKQIYETLNTGEMAENSLYWMGMCMLDAGKRENAETLFKSLLEKYPQGQKICAVYFKLASMAEESKKANEQRAYLQRLLETKNCAASNEFQRAAEILQGN
jgi:TolA-binding protein